MADSDSKPKQKHTKKKRKLKVPEDDRRPSKTQRFDFSETEKEKDAKEERPIRRPEEGRPWGNLQLILSLQNKELLLQEKVQLAYDFVATRAKEEEEDTEQGFETVSLSRVIIFLNDWIQSLLISSEKKSKVDLDKTQFRVVGTCLDFRCWEIFKFCLEESLERHVPLNISRNLLKAIHCIARNALSQLNDASLHAKESFFIVEGFELYGTVLSCVSLVFSSHNGLSNENLDLWISTVDAVLELVHKIYTDNIASGNAGKFQVLRVHPCRKNGFHDFVDKLLELLLHLLGVLNLQADGNNPGWTRDLLKLVEEVLSHGLFHPAHIDGFLSLHGKEKHGKEYDGQSEEPKMVVKSYHRHLFDKLEKIVAAKKVLPLSGIGELFRLLVVQVKKQKGALVLSEGTKIVGKTVGFIHSEDYFSGHMSMMFAGNHSVLSENSYLSSSLNSETRKSLFDFFVQIMEPLLFQIKGYLQTKLEVGPALLDVHCTLKSTNKLLASFMHEKVYVRTEDTHEGACLNFLKVVYDRIMSFSVEINQMWLSTVDADKGIHVDTLNLIGKELIAALGYFLEIDYEVIGNDLVSLWLMMLSFLAIGLSSIDMSDQSSLSSKMVDVGCQLINLYSELRQVNNAIFALCKAVRLLVSHDSDCELNYSGFMSCTNSASYEACAKSVEMLLCSQEFKFSIYNAIRSIPEGQASECVRQLTTDISDSLKWMKTSCSQSGSLLGFDLQVELLGKGLAEIYTLVLDSLNVTTGNSSLLGVSIEGLMTVIRPGMSSLVALQLDGVNEFISAVTERIFYNRVAECKNDFRKLRASTQWIFVLFFRLYMSCRSLYRQSISLVPPTSAKKMSAVMGDFYIAHTGRDWVEKTDWTEQGYFSWIVQPSASLPNIIQSILDLYPQDRVVTCSPLVYVLHTMALQRLVDLNRQIKSFEYLLQSNNKLVQEKLMDDDGLSQCHEKDIKSNKKKSRKWKRFIAVLREEATGLTDFMMGSVSLVTKKLQCFSSFDDTTCKDTCAKALHEDDAWDLGVCAVNEKTLPTAIWWVLCQNIDIWCTHAAKKKLKTFLSLLICTSLPHIGSSFGERKVSVGQISMELLSDTTLYEQKFVCRHIASRFFRNLGKSLSPLLRDAAYRDFYFNSSPNWQEVLSAFDNLSVVVSGVEYVTNDCASVAELTSHLSNRLPTELNEGKKAFLLQSMEFTAWQSSLNLLCWMSKGYSNSRSFSLYTTCILNLERFVVCRLIKCHCALCSHNHYELYRLFLSCRRTLKHLIMAFCEEKMEASQSSLTSIFPEVSFPVLWLLKSVSVMVGLQHTFSEDRASQFRYMSFSLMDQTSYVFLMFSKSQFSHVVHFSMNVKKSCAEQHNSDLVHEESHLTETDPCSDSSKAVDAWKNVVLVAEALKEQTENLLISLKDALCNKRVEVGTVDLNRLSSLVSCFQGFMWGLASAMNHIDVKECDDEMKLLKWKNEPFSKLNLCINVFTDFIDFSLCMFLIEDDQQPEGLGGAQNLSGWTRKMTVHLNPLRQKSKTARSSGSLHIDNDSENTGGQEMRLQLDSAVCATNFLSDVDLFELRRLNRPLLRSLLKLFIASSAILRLNLQINCIPLSSCFVPIFNGISQLLLLELANMADVPQPISLVWLDGVLKYLEELGNQFPLTNPTLYRDVYAKLIDLHLKAIGKCISLQGKRATLASHDAESSTKTLTVEDVIQSVYKEAIRVAFIICYTVHMGKGFSITAAGIDCLDLVLEFVSGRKRLSVVKRHLKSLIAGLFNIVLHLQSPFIFYRKLIHNKGQTDPDPGSVILMCIEVLTRISGKHALFQMDPCHLQQCLRIPAALFQSFRGLRLSDAPASYNFFMFSDNQDNGSLESMDSCTVDRQFTIDLFAACCRLLNTVLKHHKSECEQCIALLEDSVCVLLRCLETVDADSVVRKVIFHGKEIDDALRPGVYALIDACSADDLQYLHTVFGEGPCRSTLATLQHDYKLNFQYEGKV
ncbi:hypothetical protein AAG906_000135 [Vitis piasezkii]